MNSIVQSFTSKASTLRWLEENSDFSIPPVFIVKAAEWQKDPSKIVSEINRRFFDKKLAVRSSCSKEDTSTSSAAGAFTSLLNIPGNSCAQLSDAINTVFASYGFANGLPPHEEVLVQPMVNDIEVSGVILTRTLSNGAPYYVINYDDESGRTDTITSGTGVNKTVFVYSEASAEDFDSSRLYILYAFAKKIEKTCNRTGLDIEFGLDSSGKMHLFQVRPICSTQEWSPATDSLVKTNIRHITSFLNSKFVRSPYLFGQKTILGVMPDWNPAEMIGITPRPLASSLYRELITKRIWSQAREAMGYRTMPPEELMILVAGRPYIDVRTSFNSFLPRNLDRNISEKMVTAWLNRLDQHPELHDKIEFDVAQTVMDFCFEQNLNERYPGLLTEKELGEFRSKLIQLTQTCLDTNPTGSLAQSEQTVRNLYTRQQNRIKLEDSLLAHISFLVEECKYEGTLPFSIIARHGFIAESLLRTAIKRGALSRERVAELKNSIRTISGEMSHAFAQVVKNKICKDDFLKKYGHLRPGSYDILSPCYSNRKELFNNGYTMPEVPAAREFVFTADENKNLVTLLKEAGLNGISPAALQNYISRAVAGREFAKFVFTRNISDILESIAMWGEQHGFSREELAFLRIEDIIGWNAVSLLRTPKSYFSEQIEKGKELYKLGRNLQLGYIIRSTRDVYVVPQHRSAPNFVGSSCIEAPVVCLDIHSSCDVKLTQKIVCIENADPGFDWIFTRGIAGLVTKFGGANSHMAIRCAEYGLPAAIGVGEKQFAEISRAQIATLNAGNHTLLGHN